MKLTKDEIDYLLHAIDTDVHEKGLKIAGLAHVVATKLQRMRQEAAQGPYEQAVQNSEDKSAAGLTDDDVTEAIPV